MLLRKRWHSGKRCHREKDIITFKKMSLHERWCSEKNLDKNKDVDEKNIVVVGY